MGLGRSHEWDLSFAKIGHATDDRRRRSVDARRVTRLAFTLATIVLAFSGAAVAARAPHGHARTKLDPLSAAVLVQVNGVRRAHGLRPLRASTRLTAAASQHSGEMAWRGYFEHASFDGTAFWRRIQRFYARRGYRTWSVGENLLWSSPDVDAAGAVRMWMNSPEHRANLLARTWREIGLAAIHVPSAPGVYEGAEVTIVTADFGARR